MMENADVVLKFVMQQILLMTKKSLKSAVSMI